MFSRLKTLSVRLLCCFQRTSHLTEKNVTHESCGTNLILRQIRVSTGFSSSSPSGDAAVKYNRKAFYFRKRKILLPSADERVGFITYSSSLLFIINYYAALKFLCFEVFLSHTCGFQCFFVALVVEKCVSACSGEEGERRREIRGLRSTLVEISDRKER